MEPTNQTIHDYQPAVRKLYRSRSERQIGGVSGGIAEYTNTDPTLVRALFIVLAVMGPGLLLYSLLCIFVPESPQPFPDRQQPRPASAGPMQAA